MPKRVDELNERLADLLQQKTEVENRLRYVKTELSGLGFLVRQGDNGASKQQESLTSELAELDLALTELQGDVRATGELLRDAEIDMANAELSEAKAEYQKLECQAIEKWLEMDDCRASVRESQNSFELAARQCNDGAILLRSLGDTASGFVLPSRSDAAIRREFESKLELLQSLTVA